MGFSYLCILLAGFFTGTLFIGLFKNISLRYNILSVKGIPCTGGISMGLAFLIMSVAGFFIYGGSFQTMMGILIPSSAMLLFGIIDDKEELSVLEKFSVQVIAVALMVLFGIRTKIVYIGAVANVIVTFIWVIGIANAFNHLDIIDGLAAGSAGIVCLGFFVICVFNKDATTAFLTIALTGIILSFLIRNLPPAKIYMGNSGSHFLGFVLSAIALAISYAPLERKVALLSPVFILGLPVFDTAFLILMRLRQGIPAFKKSDDHIALRLQKIGYSKEKTLLYNLLLALFFTLCGVLLSRLSNFAGFIVIAIVASLSLFLSVKMSKISVNARMKGALNGKR